eukprot:scaffold4712_cov21-Tisochrysis_lutea.AAC.3
MRHGSSSGHAPAAEMMPPSQVCGSFVLRLCKSEGDPQQLFGMAWTLLDVLLKHPGGKWLGSHRRSRLLSFAWVVAIAALSEISSLSTGCCECTVACGQHRVFGLWSA